jgi:hypothetical protein
VLSVFGRHSGSLANLELTAPLAQPPVDVLVRAAALADAGLQMGAELGVPVLRFVPVFGLGPMAVAIVVMLAH